MDDARKQLTRINNHRAIMYDLESNFISWWKLLFFDSTVFGNFRYKLELKKSVNFAVPTKITD